MMFLCQRGGETASHPAAHILKPFCRGSAITALKVHTNFWHTCMELSRRWTAQTHKLQRWNPNSSISRPRRSLPVVGEMKCHRWTISGIKHESYFVFLPTFKKNRLFFVRHFSLTEKYEFESHENQPWSSTLLVWLKALQRKTANLERKLPSDQECVHFVFWGHVCRFQGLHTCAEKKQQNKCLEVKED